MTVLPTTVTVIVVAGLVVNPVKVSVIAAATTVLRTAWQSALRKGLFGFPLPWMATA